MNTPYRKVLGLLAFVVLGACKSTSGPTDLATADRPSIDQSPAGMDAEVVPPADVRLLFVGDSYTYVNDLPTVLRDVAASDPSGLSVSVVSIAVPGATLQMHYEVTGALERIRGGGFTHVVMHGQSVEPFFGRKIFLYFAGQLGLEAQRHGAVPVYFETWARGAGDPSYAEGLFGGSPAAMQAGLRDAYRAAAALVGGSVAPVGDGWEIALASTAPPTLYAADRSHPSPLGTYLAACVIYRRIFGRASAGLDGAPSGITADERAMIQAVADSLPISP